MDSNESIPPKRSTIKRIFISPDEPRLRAGWRLLLQIMLLLSVGSTTIIALQFLLQLYPLPPTPEMATLLNGLVALISITISVFIARRLFDRRTIVSLGLKINMQALEDILAGFLIPALMMAAIFFLEYAFGWTEYIGLAWQQLTIDMFLPGLLIGLVTFIAVGWQEELLFRGYLLQNLEEGISLPWGILISSILFSAFHLLNPNTEQIIMVVLGILLSGLFLAYAYLRTRSLWLPIGLHIGWNFFEGPIFGFPVSGISSESLFLHAPIGPDLITGGAFGPEAGLIFLPALGLGFALVYYVTHGRVVSKIDGRLSQPSEDQSVDAEDHHIPSESDI
jgi:membrane protease YdiL (CAAX protease family)